MNRNNLSLIQWWNKISPEKNEIVEQNKEKVIKIIEDVNDCDLDFKAEEVFDPDEIVDYLYEMAENEGIEEKFLKLTRITYDRNNKLMYIKISVDENLTKAFWWKEMFFNFHTKWISSSVAVKITRINLITLSFDYSLFIKKLLKFKGWEWFIYDHEKEDDDTD
ncbi:MAG: hypothetical protein ACD_4C00136G0004 [uncultured bacterium (gcode 4)]|uniref:Uncharacterized protein n=1 Tax=uncultured bacterium (gcode 4) TaxID=1234023 RepID=K2G9K3_9BACT|nr:MAG: hypothetical protein ACD_4C00136G0004 [uncultured bacterium (gcode 4)]